MTDGSKANAGMDTRKKATIGIIIVVVLVLGYVASGMFGGGGEDVMQPVPEVKPATVAATGGNAPPGGAPAAGGAPTAGPTAAPPPPRVVAPVMSQREMELMKLQQETQAKYVQAVNDLQMLKLTLEIAETNKGIVAAKLDTIKNEKDIVDLLSPPKKAPPTPNYASDLSGQPGDGTIQGIDPSAAQKPKIVDTGTPVEQVTYTVISVSQLQNRWNAVVGASGNLYSVHVGDVLPADGSKVTEITNTGITVVKDGKEKKISLIPII